MRLFTTLLIVLLSFQTHLHAQYEFMGVTHKREIPLKGASAEEDLIMRSPVLYPIWAFIDGSSLQIEFTELPCTVEVSILNVQTDQIFYSETCIATDTKMISLSELESGEYRLEFSLNENTAILYGDFNF